MRDLMVGDELRGIALEQTAAALASIVIALEDFHTQSLPARDLVTKLSRAVVSTSNQSAKGRLHCYSRPVIEETR
jgi:hypothetical protein